MIRQLFVTSLRNGYTSLSRLHFYGCKNVYYRFFYYGFQKFIVKKNLVSHLSKPMSKMELKGSLLDKVEPSYTNKVFSLETEDVKKDIDGRIKLTVINDHDADVDILKSLEKDYHEAKRATSNTWLDYSKSCYIYIYRGGGEPTSNLAAFDLDGTLIRPKSNKRIPKSATDWELFSVWTKVKLSQILKENEARFVIFTNQNGVGLSLVPLGEVQERIELVTKRINIPCLVFVAIDKDEFRKPDIGMFRLFMKSFNNSIQLDYQRSFYCGDAVGYPSHSDADIKFAQTLGLPFVPPDKFVRGVKPKLIPPLEQKSGPNKSQQESELNGLA